MWAVWFEKQKIRSEAWGDWSNGSLDTAGKKVKDTETIWKRRIKRNHENSLSGPVGRFEQSAVHIIGVHESVSWEGRKWYLKEHYLYFFSIWSSLQTLRSKKVSESKVRDTGRKDHQACLFKLPGCKELLKRRTQACHIHKNHDQEDRVFPTETRASQKEGESTVRKYWRGRTELYAW